MTGNRVTWADVRDANAAVVLEAICDDPPLCGAEIARRTRLSKPTVSSVLDRLSSAGLIRPVAAPDETHYRAVYVEPAFDIAHVLGLDIGRRFVRGVLADLNGALLDRIDVTIGDSEPRTVLDAAARIRDEIARDLPLELVVAGAPGVLDSGGVLRSSNVFGLEGFAIEAGLAATLGAAVAVENDTNLAALGEREAGRGRGVADFVFLSVGTGVGAGLVLGGRPHRGHRGAAGEVDDPPPHHDLAPDSPSGDAFQEWAAAWIAAEGSDLAATPEAVFQVAPGDELARRILAEEARRIAVRIAEITRVVDVELVVLGGGIGLACEKIIPEVEAALAALLWHPPRVTTSGLGADPVLVGAVTYGSRRAWRQITARRIRS